jgi:hypothetical protein
MQSEGFECMRPLGVVEQKILEVACKSLVLNWQNRSPGLESEAALSTSPGQRRTEMSRCPDQPRRPNLGKRVRDS